MSDDFERALAEWSRGYYMEHGYQPAPSVVGAWAREWLVNKMASNNVHLNNDNKKLRGENERLREQNKILSDKMKKKRDEMANKYGQDNHSYSVGSQEAMLRRYSDRFYSEEGFKAGFTAAYALMQVEINKLREENERLKARNAELVEVLLKSNEEFCNYCGKNTWVEDHTLDCIVGNALKNNKGGE